MTTKVSDQIESHFFNVAIISTDVGDVTLWNSTDVLVAVGEKLVPVTLASVVGYVDQMMSSGVPPYVTV